MAVGNEMTASRKINPSSFSSAMILPRDMYSPLVLFRISFKEWIRCTSLDFMALAFFMLVVLVVFISVALESTTKVSESFTQISHDRWKLTSSKYDEYYHE